MNENRVKTIYIEPGSPWQKGFVESFRGWFQGECLNREQLWTLTEARVVVGDFRQRYNEIRPHSRPGYESPAAFAREFVHLRFRSGYAHPQPGMDKEQGKQQHQTNGWTNASVIEQIEPGRSGPVGKLSV